MAVTPAVPAELFVRRSDPIYNAHSYLTKVPVSAITPFIERFTSVGETVCDPFAGSGMTGVAAAMLDRRAALSDISVLGQHVGTNYVRLVAGDALRARAQSVLAAAAERLGTDPYAACCDRCGHQAELVRRTWSVVYRCGACAQDVVFYEMLRTNDWSKRDLSCPSCETPFSTRSAARMGEIPVEDTVLCACTGRQQSQVPNQSASLVADHLGLSYPHVEIGSDREMYRRSALRRHGLTEVSSFFSSRNLAVLASLCEAISGEPDAGLREKLGFAFTAILARASKRYQWSRQRPLNASHQNYYIAPVFYEWNVFDLFSRKVEAVIRSDEQIRTHRGDASSLPDDQVDYRIASATRLTHLEDSSVDYVFTDPPFGSNIFYSDMNLFAEAWLGRHTERSEEAVISTGRGRRVAEHLRYERLLTASFRECARVLRPGRALTVVFSNSSGSLWALLRRALEAARFEIDPEGITLLDKGQRSVKGLASGIEDTVTCDAMLTMRTRSTPCRHSKPFPPPPLQDVLEHVLRPELTTLSHVYLALVREYARQGWDMSDLHLTTARAALVEYGLTADRQTGHLIERPAVAAA